MRPRNSIPGSLPSVVEVERDKERDRFDTATLQAYTRAYTVNGFGGGGGGEAVQRSLEAAWRPLASFSGRRS